MFLGLVSMFEQQMKHIANMKILAQELLYKDWLTEPVKDVILKNIEVLDYFKKEGYWKNPHVPSSYPMPIENSFEKNLQIDFLKKLSFIEDMIINKKHPKSIPQSQKMSFMGYSFCRCCGQKNGNKEFLFNGWAWPEGLRHYIEVHQVRPSEEFETFIAKIYFRLHNHYKPLKITGF